MTDKERMQELIDVYCDADSRSQYSEEELQKHSPSLTRILEIMGDAA